MTKQPTSARFFLATPFSSLTRGIVFLCAFLAMALGAAQAQYALAPVWSQQSPASNPGIRYIHSMAYDAGHAQVVLFGGFASGGYANDTWLWNGLNWTQANPANVPPQRAAPAMVYDPVHGNVVMFGGFTTSSTRLNDTWLWDGTNWTNVTPATITATNSPSPRSNAGIAFDAALGEVVLFGGTNGSGLSDTWLWNGTAWTQWTNPTPANNPSPRAEPGMAYDAATSQVVLFGGNVNSVDMNDTWTWNGTAWTQQSISAPPTAREAAGMDYDAVLGEVVMFGGESGSTYLNDTWAYNGTNWTQLATSTTPAARVIPNAMVYDSAHQQMVMFGGYDNVQLSDTWEFGPPAGNFGNVNVCPAGATTPAPCSATISFTVNVSTLQNLGTPQVLTQGSSGLDFTLASGSTCQGVGSTGSCVVNTTFTPTAPGLRTGSVQLLFPGQTGVALNIPVYGVGQAPAVAIAPSPQGTINTGSFTLGSPRGVLADGAGNLFISDATNKQVLKVTPGGNITTVGTGWQFPQGMAEDGTGNLFIADNNLNEVVEVPVGCTTASCQVILGSNLRSQLGVAVDGAGDLFIGDFLDGKVVESPAGCTTAACQIVVYSPASGSNPVGLTTDSAGDLFVADFGLKQVVEVPAGCTTASCQIQIGSGWSQPDDVAVDAAGEIFVADAGLDEVIELPVGCNSLTCGIVLFNGTGAVAVAVDPAGDIFADNLVLNNVMEIIRSQLPSASFSNTNVGSTSGPLSFTFQNIGNQPLNAASPGLITVNGPNFVNVAGSGTPVDCSASSTLAPGASCNLSVEFAPQAAGALSSTAVFSDNALNAAPATQAISLSGTGVGGTVQLIVSMLGGGAGTVTSNVGGLACTESAGGGASGSCSVTLPIGTTVTLTAQGTATSLFTSWGDSCNNSGQNSTCTLTLNTTNLVLASFANQTFGNVNVCPAGQSNPGSCSNSLAVTVSPLISGTVGAIQVVTQGATGLDFSLASGGSCTGFLIPGSPCTVNVNFTPLAPGLRTGSVQMFNSAGVLMATTPIFGVGQGSAIAFGPGGQISTFVPTGGAGVTVDAAGNIYMAGGAGATKISPTGVQTPISITGTGNAGFYDVAVDGAGNIYLADENNDRVVEVTPAGVQTTVPATGLSRTTGVAVDGSGNLFITDLDNNRVVKITPNGVQTTVPATGVSNPYYPAVDAAGDVFFLNAGTGQVYKVTPAGVQSTIPVSGLIAGNGVAVDAAGDVYVSDQVLNVVYEITPGGVQTTLATNGLNIPAGLAVDAAGDVLIADNSLSSLVVLNRSLTPVISFATTNVGSTSSDSPVTFSIQNVGNQPLTGSLALNLGGSFAQNATPDCSTQFPIAPGGICSESFSFTPQSATFFSGTATFTDNIFNSSPLASQTINMVGTGATNGVAGTVAVPNVVGQTQAAAAAPLAGVGLSAGTVSTTSSQTVPSGSIISENPVAGTQVAVGSVVNLLVSSGLPTQPSPNPLTLENNYFLTGDYVSAGVTLRGTGVKGIATGTINIPNATQSATQGVPDGADIIDAFLYWQTLENTPYASSTNGTFNGYPIVGQQIGNDVPNYTDGALTGTIRSYRANVNIYLPVQPSGIRIVSGAYTISLPDSGGSTYPLTEGASLVLVYRVLSPNFPLKSVVIYDGAGQPTAGATQVVQGFYDAVGGANGTGKNTNLFATPGSWNNSVNTVTLGQSNQYSAPLNPSAAYAAVILSTPVNNSDNDGILDAWKAGPPAGDFHAGQPGYYDVKTSTWVGLPGAKHGQKDLFVQMDYMCGAVLASGACDPTQENLFPSPDVSGNDPLVMVQQAFAQSGVQLHLQVGNAVPESTCTDDLTTTPATLCQFPGQPGVIGWKNSLEFSKLYPRNLASCLAGGDCTTRFPYGQKDSYHYVLFGHSLAIPAWNTRYGTLTSINVANGVTTITTVDRGPGINACPSRITLGGVLGNPGLNGIYNTTSCPDTKTIIVATPGVSNWSYPNTALPEPVIGLTSGTVTSISGYSDLGGADSAVTLGLWLTAVGQNMSTRATVVAGTLFHEIGHTLGLSHGGLYYDTPNSYVPTFEANCKPNYQSIMNYLFQLDGVGPNGTIAYSNQTLNTLNENLAGSVLALTDGSNNPATFSTSSWYVPYTTGTLASPATLHCDGTPLEGESIYRVNAPVSPIAPPWSNGQDLSGIGALQTEERGYNDLGALDLRQIGATGGEFAELATQLSFGSSVVPLNIGSGGNVTLGSGGTVALGSGGNVTLGSGGNVTLGSGGTITLPSGGNVTLGSGGNVTFGSGATVTPTSGGNITLGSGGNVTFGSGGTVTLPSGGNVTLGSGGNVTLGSGGTIALGSGGVGGTVTIPSTGGSYFIDSNGGNITLGSGGNVTFGSGVSATLSSGGNITLGSGGNVTFGSGVSATLSNGGNITLGSGGNITLGSGGNVTLGSGGNITLGSGGNITFGSGGNVTLGSGGTVTLGSSGNVTLGSGGNVTLGSGGSATLGAGGTVTLGAGGNVTLGSGGNVTLGSGATVSYASGGNITMGSGGNVTFGSGGNVTLGSGGTISVALGGNVTFGSAGTVTLASGGAVIPISAGGSYSFTSSAGNITLGSGGNVTFGSGVSATLSSGGNITLGSGGNVTFGSGISVALGTGGNITMGSGGNITFGSGGNVTLGSGGVVTLGTGGGSVNLGSGPSSLPLASVPSSTPGSGGPVATELTYETANSVVRVPTSPTETVVPAGVSVTWNAPAFGVVQTYTIYRSSNGATPIVIGSVSGVNGNPPATEFTDTNPDLTSKTVVYTVTTTLVPDTTGGTQRSSAQSAPAVLKNDQTIALGPLPSSVLISNPPTVTATAMTGGAPNGLQVAFSTTGSCSIGSQSILNNVSSATLVLSTTGSCTVIASQPGTTAFNAANSVSGTFMVLPQGSSLQSQTINFPTLPNVQYGNSFSLSATSSSGLPVSFTASSGGPCKTDGSISGVGMCSITASVAGNSTYSAASLTQSFTVYPAVLKVTATNVSGTYGQALPALTYSYSGFVKNDTASIVNGAPALSTSATTTSGPGSYPITVSTGTLATMNYSFLYVSGTLTIQPATQAALTLNAASPLTFNQSETLSVTGGTTNGAVTYAVAPGAPCTVSGAKLTANSGTGTCLVTATMAGNANYAAVSSPVVPVVLSPASQAITFTTKPPASAAYNSTFTVAATGGPSANPVTFTSGGSCSNVGATYTMTNSTGTCSVIANQAGNSNYAPAATVTSAVSATGPLLSLSTSSINFGTMYVGAISIQTITVSNIGTAPTTINDPILSIVKGGNSDEFIALSLCPKPLAAGKSCSVTIAFLAGPFYTPQTATLQIMSNAPGSPQPVALSATVINPMVGFSPTSLSFGTIKHATSSSLNVVLSNPGATPLSLTGISVAGSNAAYFAQTNNCPTSLAAGASCTVAVKFTPATTGTFSASLVVVDNAQAGGGTQTVALSGKGN